MLGHSIGELATNSQSLDQAGAAVFHTVNPLVEKLS